MSWRHRLGTSRLPELDAREMGESLLAPGVVWRLLRPARLPNCELYHWVPSYYLAFGSAPVLTDPSSYIEAHSVLSRSFTAIPWSNSDFSFIDLTR